MTLKKIAKLANVSLSTASKALANSKDVSADTVRLVRRTAEENGYLQEVKKRKLEYRKSTSPTIAIICPEIISIFYSYVVTYLSELIQQREGKTAIYISGFNAADQEKVMGELVVNPSIDGIIFIPAFEPMKFDAEILVPVVQIGGEFLYKQFDMVSYNLKSGVYQAIAHLKNLGHVKIGFIGEALASHKLEVFKEAMAEIGLAVDPRHIYVNNCRFEQVGYSAMVQIKEIENLPTAFLTAYDEVAFGAIRALEENKIRVPADISIIGINDIPAASYASTSITTLNTHIKDLCEKAVEILLYKVNNPKYAVISEVNVQCNLIIRETTTIARQN